MQDLRFVSLFVFPQFYIKISKKCRGHNSSKNDFFEKKIFDYFLVAEYKPVCKIWDLYHFSFFHNSTSKIQRIYKEKTKRGHNSAKKWKFKNLKKTFSYFHLRYTEPKFQGSRLNGVVRSEGDRHTDRQTSKWK